MANAPAHRLSYKSVFTLVIAMAAVVGWMSGCAGISAGSSTPSDLTIAPNNLSLNAAVGGSASGMVTVVNQGTGTIHISQANVTGTGFSMGAAVMPMSVAAGQHVSFAVKFAASNTTSVQGTLALATDAQRGMILVPLTGKGASKTAQVTSVSVTPSLAAPAAGTKTQFAASVQGVATNKSVTWSASVGSITAGGLFTAPPPGSTGLVTATSVADPSKSATVPVSVAGTSSQSQTGTVSSVTVSPATAKSATSGTLQFTADVLGTASNKGVTWKASSGTVSASGMFTAPSKAGSASVTATSVADPTKAATATVTVNAISTPPPSDSPSIKSFAASPVTVQAGQASTLQWDVTGATSLAISGIGAVTGTSVKVTPVVTTTYTLTASNASGSASESVTVGAQQGAALATASVDPSKPGFQIPGSFMGYSHEWNSQDRLLGQPTQPNPYYRQLIKNLLAYGAGPLIIRFGGNTTDKSGEPTSTTVAPMSQLAKDLNVKFTLGVNLASNNLQLAADQAQNYVANMPAGSLEAIEVGNEPDEYVKNGFRPSSYTFASYLSDFAKWRTRLLPLLPSGTKLMGPSWAFSETLVNLPGFLAQEKNNLWLVSQHNYAGSETNGPNPPDYLLQDLVVTRTAKSLLPGIAAAKQAGMSIRMAEMNSISTGGGEVGVSDTFASALWVTDVMFALANEGVVGVNLHGDNSPYSLFTFKGYTDPHGVKTYTLLSVRPEYARLAVFPAGDSESFEDAAGESVDQQEREDLGNAGFQRCRAGDSPQQGYQRIRHRRNLLARIRQRCRDANDRAELPVHRGHHHRRTNL